MYSTFYRNKNTFCGGTHFAVALPYQYAFYEERNEEFFGREVRETPAARRVVS
jgi:hypothetical protein